MQRAQDLVVVVSFTPGFGGKKCPFFYLRENSEAMKRLIVIRLLSYIMLSSFNSSCSRQCIKRRMRDGLSFGTVRFCSPANQSRERNLHMSPVFSLPTEFVLVSDSLFVSHAHYHKAGRHCTGCDRRKTQADCCREGTRRERSQTECKQGCKETTRRQ